MRTIIGLANVLASVASAALNFYFVRTSLNLSISVSVAWWPRQRHHRAYRSDSEHEWLLAIWVLAARFCVSVLLLHTSVCASDILFATHALPPKSFQRKRIPTPLLFKIWIQTHSNQSCQSNPLQDSLLHWIAMHGFQFVLLCHKQFHTVSCYR